MTKPWLRLYRKIVESKKIHDLRPELFKPWVLLLACTDDDGNLPSQAQLAFKLRQPEIRVNAWLETLARFKFLDRTETGYAAHDWDDWNFDSDVSTDRVKRFRKRKCNALDTDTEEDTEKDTEPKATPLAASPADLWKQVWDSGRAYLTANGHSEGDARKVLMRWRQNHNETEILRALKTAETNAVELPIPYINSLLSGKGKSNGIRPGTTGAFTRLAAKIDAARQDEAGRADVHEG